MKGRRLVPIIHTCYQCGATKNWWAARAPYGLCQKCRYVVKHSQRKPEYHQNYSLVRRFGITLEDRERMAAAQDGRCGICRRNLGAGGRDGLHVDHNHETGQIRELLCGNCNRGLGCFMESPELLLAAIEYLRKWAALDTAPDTLDVRVDPLLKGDRS